MKIGDYIALIIIFAVVVSAVVYIVLQKKKGVKCIGCPHSSKCCKYKSRQCNIDL